MIDLQDISVSFRSKGHEVHAVRGAKLGIDAGEIYGIVGASGAGKSTLLRTINLLERPTQGRVVLDGRDITDLKGAELRRERGKIGMIFQHFNLMHTCTVFENVAFTLEVAGRTREEIRKRVPELLRLVGLEDKAGAYPAQLSGGQKQRVGIARAIANDPQVLLCDEPTSALDLETSAAILELLEEINRRLGITMVLISHEMHVIKKVCNRVAVMNRGEIIEQGDVHDIFARPQHEFTKQLVEHTFDLELPQRLKESVEGKGTLLKMLFLGEPAEHPVLSEVTRRFGVSVNILHGKIEYINQRPVGLMIALLADPQESSQDTANHGAAIDYLRSSVSNLEILHA